MTNLRTIAVIIGILILLSIKLSAGFDRIAALESSEENNFTREECWFESPLPLLAIQEFECGYVSVPLRHNQPEGTQISIPVAIIRASTENPFPDPLFLAQGGPGGDAFDVFPILIGSITQELNRDIVIFNQRGTRYARPSLLCTESFAASSELITLPPEVAEEQSLISISNCYSRLISEGIDLSAFNSLENAADVDAIRQALGYDEYNFYGVSYGTLLGLHLMRNHPEHLRSVVLDSVVPPNINFIPQIAYNMDRVFTNIINTCNEDPQCASEYPNLEERFFTLVDSLNESPITLSIKNSSSGERVNAYLDGDTLIDVLFQSFYLPDSYAIFPKLIDNLENGDFTFIQGIWPLFAFDETLSEGMYLSVICSEDADFEAQDAEIEGIHPYFADSAPDDLQSYLDACEIWQVDLLPDTVDDAVASEIPTLLLSGHYDPITPPEFAEIAAQTLDNSYIYVGSTSSHGVAFDNDCTNQIVLRFLAEPTRQPDMNCRDDISFAPFIQSDALSFPFLAEVNQLTPSMWWQLGLGSVFLLGILSSFIVLPIIWLIGLVQKPAHSQKERKEKYRLQKWLVAIMILIFGLLAVIFVIGTTIFTVQSLFSGLAGIFALSGDAAPFFIIPYILIIIAISVLIITSITWYKRAWSIWIRIYFSFVVICAIGYILVLAEGGMMSVLL